MAEPSERGRVAIRVEGVVQGVGFRPFLYALAARHRLAGHVGNDPHGVFIEAEGAPDALAAFGAALRTQAPPLAVVERLAAVPIPARGETGFRIVASAGDPLATSTAPDAAAARAALVPADTATCADCLRELWDPADRRYRYPFTNCTNCGRRFSIITGVPYDRPATTMAGFALCAACRAEYTDPANRRFHAQPICCPACGPRLCLVDAAGRSLPGDPIGAAAALLRAGRVLAVKGIGGYHLAVDATNDDAVALLRARKRRPDKPFAVMIETLAAAHELCWLDAAEAAALCGPGAPIVLARRRDTARVAAAVAPRVAELGLLLAYAPPHHLLLREIARPTVMTSGNVSDEPIAHDDAEARRRLRGIADAWLTHDRPIHAAVEDSLVRGGGAALTVLRRGRGHAPAPVNLADPLPRPVLGVGAELKNTFCLAAGTRAFVSPHVGDLTGYETACAYRRHIERLRRLLALRPEVIAHDLHPDYVSTGYARELAGLAEPVELGEPAELGDVELVGVQHHHAHLAACLAEHGEPGPVIGVTFDGTGYGTDGSVWGGEFLIADLAGFTRVASLAPVRMPGGDAAVREPWRMAAAHLDVAFDGAPPAGLAVARRNAERWEPVRALARTGPHAPVTTSAGRLFDAVAALVLGRDTVSYEGQAACELEAAVDPRERGGYPVSARRDEQGLSRLDGAELVRAVVADVRADVAPALIAARFHHGLASGITEVCLRLRATTGLNTVALAGGVFANQVLRSACGRLLGAAGVRVLTPRRLPCGDGGISLGQVVVAGARDRARDTPRCAVPEASTALDPPAAARLGHAHPPGGRGAAE